MSTGQEKIKLEAAAQKHNESFSFEKQHTIKIAEIPLEEIEFQ